MVFRTIDEFRGARSAWSGNVGFVPTMGALHEGHLDLVRTAKAECEHVVVSIFVNPTQFGPNEDYARYPRREEQDMELARGAGATAFFVPSAAEVYRNREAGQAETEVHVPEVTESFEGASRPGHFVGVATVVLKLFNIVQPTVAYFGQKDLQQCAVIRRMVLDLDVPVRLRFVPTTRAEDGLALSSRNQYLSPDERQVAPLLYQTLVKVKEEWLRGTDGELRLESHVSRLEEAGFRVEYLELIDRDRMCVSRSEGARLSVVVAARLGNTRLIDNIAVTEVDG